MKYLNDCKKISNFKFILILSFLIADILNNISIIKILNTSNPNKNDQLEYFHIEDYDEKILLPIQEKLKGFIEITKDEQRFLNGLIRKIKPKKIVEIGVAFGGTSTIILNAIKDMKNSKLFSFDINKRCYKMKSKETGFIVKERFPELADKWELNTGAPTCEFIEKIGNEIDVVYIDTVHFTPGEMINWLEILPFLKEEAIVIIHDTFFMYFNNRVAIKIKNYSNNQILCYIRGDLILPSYSNNTFSHNIGALKLHKNQKKYYLQYFLALGTQWSYLPSDRELNILKIFFRKYYGAKYVKIFNDAIEKNIRRFNRTHY